MTIDAIQKTLQTALLTIYEKGEATTITGWIMEHYTGKNNVQRMMEKTTILTDEQIQSIQQAVSQLLQHKPVQYVLGEAYFMGMRFVVNESVLIPRPETEELVALACSIWKPSDKNIIDIGTGSGCIAITLKEKLSQSAVTALDNSEAALAIARKNAAQYCNDIDFLQIDFLDEDQWNDLPVFDMIVSNPPYIPLMEKIQMDKNVTAWEPHQALFVPDDHPLLFYKKIADFGKTHLSKNGVVIVEIHQHFSKETSDIFTSCEYTTTIQKDVYGNDRIIMANPL